MTTTQTSTAQYVYTEKDLKALASLEWISQHRQEYGGQWVALDGARLLAAGTDALAVHAAAVAQDVELSMIGYVEPADAPPFIF